MLVSVYISLIRVLVQTGRFEEASSVLQRVAKVRERMGWPCDQELQELMAKDWFTPGASLPDVRILCKGYAHAANELLNRRR